MKVDMKKIADVVVAQCEGQTASQIASIMKDLVGFMAQQQLLGKWRQLERELDGAWARKYGAANVTVVTAQPLTSAARKALEARAPGADIKEVVDDRLIGGAIVRLDNTRIDGSVTGALMRLKNAMYSEV